MPDVAPPVDALSLAGSSDARLRRGRWWRFRVGIVARFGPERATRRLPLGAVAAVAAERAAVVLGPWAAVVAVAVAGKRAPRAAKLLHTVDAARTSEACAAVSAVAAEGALPECFRSSIIALAIICKLTAVMTHKVAESLLLAFTAVLAVLAERALRTGCTCSRLGTLGW